MSRVLLLSSLVYGPLARSRGPQLPGESRCSRRALPILIDGHARCTSASWSRWSPCGSPGCCWSGTSSASRSRSLGQAPRAARFAGFSDQRLIWFCFLLSAAACAGLAGLFEVGGPGRPAGAGDLPAGYGFTAIIVAFLGRLHPVGILFAGLLLALTYIGGETAQIAMSLPSATTGRVPGHAPVLPARRRRAGELPPALDIRRVVRRRAASAKPPVPQPAPAHSVEHRERWTCSPTS